METYKRAKRIADKSPNLVMRPMLLRHIDDLVKENREYKFSYETYKSLINRWIDREASKPRIRIKYGSEEIYKALLYEFSKQLAVNVYLNRKSRGGYFISKDDNFGEDVKLKESEVDYLKF